MDPIETSITLSLTSTLGDSITLGDVKEWVRRLELFNVHDDTPVYNAHLLIDFPIFHAEKIYCSDCAPLENNSDILITMHQCNNVSVNEPS